LKGVIYSQINVNRSGQSVGCFNLFPVMLTSLSLFFFLQWRRRRKKRRKRSLKNPKMTWDLDSLT